MKTLRQNKNQLGVIAFAGVLIVIAILVGRSQSREAAPSARPRISVEDFKRSLQESGVWLGGPGSKYVDVGRQTFATSVSRGLMPDHKVLDIGAGSLRIGWWFLQYVKPENYHAIEPVRERVDTAAKLLGVDINLYYNDDWEFPDIDFDFVIARSIWTHASKNMIAKMISEFAENSSSEGRFLTSFIAADDDAQDYKGTEWSGRVLKSEPGGGCISHSLEWVRNECLKHDLDVRVLDEQHGQTWLLITRKNAPPVGPRR